VQGSNSSTLILLLNKGSKPYEGPDTLIEQSASTSNRAFIALDAYRYLFL